MSAANRLVVKNLAYKVPSILKLVEILNNTKPTLVPSHAQNIEFVSSCYGYKSYASIKHPLNISIRNIEKALLSTSIIEQSNHALFKRLVQLSLASSTTEMTEIKSTVCTSELNSINFGILPSTTNSMWRDKAIFFRNSTYNQIDRIIGFDCINEDFDNILKELYNYNVFISFTEALQSLKLATPDLLAYISHLPKSHTRTHHGFICCELIKILNK